MFAQHWGEIALNKDAIPLDIDWGRYQAVENLGRLHIVTMRDAGRLVGYYCAFLDTHFHYKSTLFAFTDVYFLLPEYRRANTAFKFFQFVEKTLQDHPAKPIKATTATKLHSDKTRFFQAMKWEPTETVLTKMLR